MPSRRESAAFSKMADGASALENAVAEACDCNSIAPHLISRNESTLEQAFEEIDGLHYKVMQLELHLSVAIETLETLVRNSDGR